MIYILRQWQEGMVSGLVSHLERHQVSFEILEAYNLKRWPDLRRGDAVIGLGGPPSVCNLRASDFEHRFLLDEERFIAEARRQSIPVLGICLSHQLLAGMENQPVQCGHTIFGIQPVDLTSDGQAHWLFEGLPSRLMLYQNHRDFVVSLPASARLLGSSATCAVEAAAWDDLTVSTQFHPEVLVGQIGMAIARFPRQLANSGLTFEQMLALVPADYATYTDRLFENFLYRAGAIRRPAWKDPMYTATGGESTSTELSRRSAA